MTNLVRVLTHRKTREKQKVIRIVGERELSIVDKRLRYFCFLNIII